MGLRASWLGEIAGGTLGVLFPQLAVFMAGLVNALSLFLPGYWWEHLMRFTAAIVAMLLTLCSGTAVAAWSSGMILASGYGAVKGALRGSKLLVRADRSLATGEATGGELKAPLGRPTGWSPERPELEA